jgi:hypothetical protein
MAQLRDKQTSAFIAEGTPLQIATLASKVGFNEVIFDDVGGDFDPQAVIDRHAAHVAALAEDDTISDEYKQSVADEAKLQRGAITAAQQSIQDARDAVENAS